MRTLYLTPTKEQREWVMLELLFDFLNLPINDQLKKTESPDFIYKINDHYKIGIEVTTPMKNVNNGGSSLAKIENEQRKILKKIKAELEKTNFPKMEVFIKFSEDKKIKKNVSYEKIIKNFIKEKLPHIDDEKSQLFSDIEEPIFKMVLIRLGTHNGKQWLDKTRVNFLPFNWVNTTPENIIQSALNNKAPKLDTYKLKCDDCWLVLGVQETNYSEAISVRNLDTLYKTSFDRIFFIQSVQGKVLELKKAP